MKTDTYYVAEKPITRVTLAGEEGSDHFLGLWCEGHGDIGDKVIGKYAYAAGHRRVWGEMFNAPNEWTPA